MSQQPYNIGNSQEITTDVVDLNVDHAYIAHVQLSAAEAVAADADGILAAEALPDAAADYTTFENDMPYARNITAVCSDTQTGDMVVTGTNLAGEAITETITLTSDTPAAGAKAFKTVTNINLPIKVGSETINVGWGDVAGLPYMLTHNTVLKTYLGNTLEGTAPTVVTDVDEVEKNTIDLNSALNGSVVDVYLIV